MGITSSPTPPDAYCATAFTLEYDNGTLGFGTGWKLQCTIGDETKYVNHYQGALSFGEGTVFTINQYSSNEMPVYNFKHSSSGDRYINIENNNTTVNAPKSATSSNHSEWWFLISADQVAVYNGRVCNFSATANKNVATDSEGTASASVSVASYALANYADRTVTHSVATFTAVDKNSDSNKTKYFKGWSETADGDIISTENPYSVNLNYGTQSVTLYAIFQDKQDVAFTWNAGSEITAFSHVANVFSSSSDAPYTISSSDPTIAEVIDNTLYTYKAGSVTFTIHQDANSEWFGKENSYELTVNTNDTWVCKQGNGPNDYLSTGAKETYLDKINNKKNSNRFGADTIMYQMITGLLPGYYKVLFYATLNSANDVTYESGYGYAQVYANGVTQDIMTIAQNSCTPTDYLHGLITYVDEDGELNYGVKCTTAGGNWCVAKAHSISKLQIGNTISEVICNPTIYQQWSNTTCPYGWKAYAHNGGNGNYTQYGTQNTMLEYWSNKSYGSDELNVYNVDYYQTVTLCAGTYRLSAYLFFEGAENSVGLYAYFNDRDHVTKVDKSGTTLNKYSLDFILTETTDVNIGAKTLTTNPDGPWMAADDFELVYLRDLDRTKSLTDGYGMLYNHEYDIRLREGNTQAYAATYEGTTVTLHPLLNENDSIVPHNNVVLLFNGATPTPAASIKYQYVSKGTPVSVTDGNCFVHHDGSVSSERVNYILAKQNGVVAFYLYTGDESLLDGYNVLQLPAQEGGEQAPSLLRIVMEENTTTALVPILEGNGQTSVKTDNMQIYTILGLPVSDMSRPGIYIQNGKKYIVY